MTQTTTTPAASALPLFYSAPMLLRFQEHANFGLRKSGDLRFTSSATAIPLTTGEFAAAGRNYPIVFSSDDLAAPLAVTGLNAGRNLFVSPEGTWREGHYIPAYVRRYPFISVEMEAGGPKMLGIDSASEHVSTMAVADGADPFFDAQGGPTERTRGAMAFCEAYALEHDRTRAFSQALLDHNLLVARTAEVTYADAGKAVVTGFRVVDDEAFAALPEKTVLEFHAKGWLASIVLHQASRLGWGGLVDSAAGERPKAA